MSQSGGLSLGRIMGGAIAGVASKAGGHTIKSIEDQRDYSKWEFFYDPTKDRSLSIGGPNGMGTAPALQNGSPGFQQQNNSQPGNVQQNNGTPPPPDNGDSG